MMYWDILGHIGKRRECFDKAQLEIGESDLLARLYSPFLTFPPGQVEIAYFRGLQLACVFYFWLIAGQNQPVQHQHVDHVDINFGRYLRPQVPTG